MNQKELATWMASIWFGDRIAKLFEDCIDGFWYRRARKRAREYQGIWMWR